MKPKRTSITVTVKNGEDFRATRPGKSFLGGGYGYERILATFPKTPSPPYKLTYNIDPRGGFRIDSDNPHVTLIKIDPIGGDYYSVRNKIYACFLPRDWIGYRVSRKVEAIR